MTEDVIVSVRGLHTLDGPKPDQQEVELLCAGKYYCRNGKQYVFYEEIDEGLNQPVKTRLTFEEGRLELQKTGPVTAAMTFAREQKTNSWYQTPMGALHSGVSVRSMQMEQSEDQIGLQVEYELELNYAHAADAKIEIHIVSKEKWLDECSGLKGRAG